MPAWTLSDLMSKATARIGRRNDLAASDVSFWVNVAYQEVAAAEPGALLETLATSSITSGAYRVTLPADVMEMVGLSRLTSNDNAGGSALTLLRTNTARLDAVGLDTASGPPASYALFSNWIELYPSSDSTYTLNLRYRAYPSDMTATTAVPSLATDWRPAVLYLAEALLHELVGNELEGAQARARYAGYVQSLKNIEAKRQAQIGGYRASIPLRRSRY